MKQYSLWYTKEAPHGYENRTFFCFSDPATGGFAYASFEVMAYNGEKNIDFSLENVI